MRERATMLLGALTCTAVSPMAQETFFLFFGALSSPRRGFALVGSGLCAACRRGLHVFVGRDRGLLLRARGGGWVACFLTVLSPLPPFLSCWFFCLLLSCFWLFLPSPVLVVAFGLLVGAPPPARCAGDVPTLLAFRFSGPPSLHRTLKQQNAKSIKMVSLCTTYHL